MKKPVSNARRGRRRRPCRQPRSRHPAIAKRRTSPALPAVDATDFYMFNSYEPGRDGYVTADRELPAAAGPLRRAQLLRARPGRAVRDPPRQRRRRREDLTFQFRFRNRLRQRGQGHRARHRRRAVAVPLKNIGPVRHGDKLAAQLPRDLPVAGPRRPPQRQPRRVTRAGDGRRLRQALRLRRHQDFRQRASYEDYARTSSTTSRFPSCDARAACSSASATSPSRSTSARSSTSSTWCRSTAAAFPGGIVQDPANDIIADKNITTLALELPKSCLTRPATA